MLVSLLTHNRLVSHGLSSDDSQLLLKLNRLVEATSVVLSEMTNQTLFIFNVFIRNSQVSESSVGKMLSRIARQHKTFEYQKQKSAHNEVKRVLKSVNDIHDIQPLSNVLVQHYLLLDFIEVVENAEVGQTLQLLHPPVVDLMCHVQEEGKVDDPLADGPGCEAPVLTRFF